MADKFSKKTRSYIMSRIRSKGTTPEIIMKNALKGFRFRYQPKIFGNPDFTSKKHKVAVFIDGCYWHGCPQCYKAPKSNIKYWLPKIRRNIERDRRYNKGLKEEGWRVIRLWEHVVIQNPSKCRERIIRVIGGLSG